MTVININEKIDVIPNDVEEEILKLINKKAPLCYKNFTDKEKNILTDKIINNKEYKKYNINLQQIDSIKSNFIKNKMVKNHPYLIKNTQNIINDYKNNKDVLYISKKYDGSPINILRIILSKRNSKEQVKKLFNNPTLLNDYDYKQFILAKKNDDYALVNNNEILKKADEFEYKIEKILIKMGVKYKTQKDLVKEQNELYGNPISTPDFLIEDELIINGEEIKWIDAKNFFGSNCKFVKSKLIKQTNKYIKNYGKGSVIFNLGFNQSYKVPDILFLSWNAFSNYD
jgi:hypothetical protein